MRHSGNQCRLCQRVEGLCEQRTRTRTRTLHAFAQENRLKDTPITLKVISFAMSNGQAPHVDKRSTESQINILNQGYLPVGLFFVVSARDM